MTAAAWPRAYRPLRPVSLLAQLAALVLVELGLYASYAAHDARFHWATHFLVGLLATAVWQAGHLLIAARPARGQVLSIVAFHLWAMWPDLAFRAGVPHYRWMDWVALGHVSAHYLPGGARGWLVPALLALAGYAVLLSRWLAARRAEAAAGLAPALGAGGAAVVSPQQDPRVHLLAHEDLAPAAPGPPGGAPLLLLHGLGGTAASWLPAAGHLTAAGHRCLVPDLLGFGHSLRIGTTYRLADQADALLRLLDDHALPRVHVVAHSWGATVAAALVRRAPERVGGLVLVNPAAFADRQVARERFAARSWLAKRTLDESEVGGLVCGTMCLLRPVVSRMVTRMDDVPTAVARGGVQHNYPAYRDALDALWDNPLPDLLRDPPLPVTVVLGDADQTVRASDVLDLPPAPAVQVVTTTGTHGLPYEQPRQVAGLVAAALDG